MATNPLRFTSAKIKEGDRWDTLAYEAYGDPNYQYFLILDNPQFSIQGNLPAGETMLFRILETPNQGKTLPPWFVEDTLNETLGETDSAAIPVVEGPPVPLGFSPGYPRVEGNKIVFAINKSARFPYSVEKTSGGVVAESSGYDFASGFAVSTADITDGGYYIVKVGSIVSAPLTVVGAGQPLAFVQAPQITKVGSSYQIKYSINKTGSYQTKVTRLTDNTVPINQAVNYTTNFVNTLSVTQTGSYKIEVGALVYNFTITDSSESTVKPSWLTAAGYAYDPNSHEFTMQLDATENTEVEVTAAVGGNPSGKDQDGNNWGAGIYNPGTSAWATPPYDERYSFNPAVAATGGLIPGSQYRFRIRRSAVPGDVFVLYFRMPTSATPPGNPTPIDLDEQDVACTVRPVLTSIPQADSDNVTATVNGQGYDSLKWRVKRASDSEVVRQGTVIMFNNGVPVFTPANQLTVNFTAIVDGDYLFEIEGGNCTSTPHSMAFTVSDGAVTPGDSGLEVSLYYSDEGTADLKCRVNGTAPYDLICSDGTDEIYTVTSSSDEIEIPDSVMTTLGNGRLTVTVIDAANKVGSVSRYKVDRDNMRVLNVGFSVANGNTENHKTMIAAGAARGFQYTGTIVGGLDTDANFNTLKSGAYDHEVTTTFAFPYDETVRVAWQNNMKLRAGWMMGRDSNKLNNGSTRTQMYSEAALMKRVDGVTPIHLPPSGPVPSHMTPSPSSPEFIDYAKRYMVAGTTRYKKAYQKGVIAWSGMPIGSSAESEYPVFYINANGDLDGYCKGDFHPQCVANFKTKHPEYTNLTNQQIAEADLNGSPLALDWAEHLAQEYATFEKTVWDYVYVQVPDLQRDAVEQIDVGSATDELSPFRRTQNVLLRCRKTLGLFKINDDPVNDSIARMGFWLDCASSIARRFSASSAYEPSPQGASFDPGASSTPYVIDSIEEATARGVGESWVTSNTGWVDNLVTASGLVPGSLLQPKLEFQISGSNKNIVRLSRNISDVFKTGALGGWETAHAAFKSANTLTHVDTLTVDDIDPVIDPGPGPGPGPDPGPDPEPGTGVFQPTLMYGGWPEVLTVNVTGVAGSTSENWLINAVTNQTPDSDKEYWWVVDDNIVKQGGALTNYPYQSNEEVSVVMMIIKKNADTLFRWANPGENKYIPGFSDPGQGQTISYRGTGASGASCVIGFQEVSTGGGGTYPTITSYLDTNAPSYSNNLIFDIKKAGQGTVFSYSKGSISRNQQVPVMSLSKAVTAAVMMTLIDDNLLELDTTIGEVLTDWTGAKGGITLQQIMNHTSGLPDNQTNEGEGLLEDWVDWYRDAVTSLEFTPGTSFAYRTVPWQVAARMAEVVTGQQWKVLWKERIASLCGMGGAEYNLFQVGPPAQSPDNPHAGYGLYCTQNEYMNFMTMIRDNGVYAGNTVISSGTLAQFWTAQNGFTTWGFGMIRNDSGDEPTAESQKGCYAWLDRSKGLACVLFTQIEDPNLTANNGLRTLVRSTVA